MFEARWDGRNQRRGAHPAGDGGVARRLSRRQSVRGAVAGISALSVPGLLAVPSGGAAFAQAAQPDALHSRVRAELARFTGWLQENGDDGRLVLVQGYEWAGAQRWPANHPTAWISDPANNLRYEAHHYWDRDNSGAYRNSYLAEVTDASQRGF